MTLPDRNPADELGSVIAKSSWRSKGFCSGRPVACYVAVWWLAERSG